MRDNVATPGGARRAVRRSGRRLSRVRLDRQGTAGRAGGDRRCGRCVCCGRAIVAGRTAVLVTAGPTLEDLDPVRFIGNRSSGRMGFAIAQEAHARGALVTLVAGPTARRRRRPCTSWSACAARARCMRPSCRAPTGADVVIMAAAVADYTPAGGAAAGEDREGRRADARRSSGRRTSSPSLARAAAIGRRRCSLALPPRRATRAARAARKLAPSASISSSPTTCPRRARASTSRPTRSRSSPARRRDAAAADAKDRRRRGRSSIASSSSARPRAAAAARRGSRRPLRRPHERDASPIICSFTRSLGVAGVSKDAAWRQREAADAAASGRRRQPAARGRGSEAAAAISATPAAACADPVAALAALRAHIGRLHALQAAAASAAGRWSSASAIPSAELMFVGEAPGADEESRASRSSARPDSC